MHPRNVLILMLVMATVALDLVVGNWVRMPIVLDEASPHFLVYVALVFAELTFIAGWVVFGGGKSIARFLIATFALWLLAWPMSGGEGIFVTRPVFVLGTFLVMVATLLTGLRLARFGITCAEDSSRKPTQVASGAAAQFSLGSFMAWITVFCVALGAALDVEVTGLHLIRIVVYLAPFVLTGLASLWSAFSFQRWWLRLTLVFALCPAMTALVQTSTLSSSGAWAYMTSASLEAILILFASHVFLTAGFRITRSHSTISVRRLTSAGGRG